jgi:hypothetical protein
MAMSWSDAAAPIVAEVIRNVGRTDMKALRRALTEAYPWGERVNTPYKAWLGEIRRQLGHPLNAPKADSANTQTEMFNQQSPRKP